MSIQSFIRDQILLPRLRESGLLVVKHQVQNFVRFCETVVKLSPVKKIRLVTGYDTTNPPTGSRSA